MYRLAECYDLAYTLVMDYLDLASIYALWRVDTIWYSTLNELAVPILTKHPDILPNLRLVIAEWTRGYDALVPVDDAPDLVPVLRVRGEIMWPHVVQLYALLISNDATVPDVTLVLDNLDRATIQRKTLGPKLAYWLVKWFIVQYVDKPYLNFALSSTHIITMRSCHASATAEQLCEWSNDWLTGHEETSSYIYPELVGYTFASALLFCSPTLLTVAAIQTTHRTLEELFVIISQYSAEELVRQVTISFKNMDAFSVFAGTYLQPASPMMEEYPTLRLFVRKYMQYLERAVLPCLYHKFIPDRLAFLHALVKPWLAGSFYI